MTRPLAKTEGGIAAARDAGLSFGDALTMGYGSQALGAQDAVKEANANLGILAPLVQGGGYVAGPGKVLGPLARGAVGLTGLGTEAGAGLAARLGASAAGGGLEGGAAGGLGAGGHGGDVAQGALTGGLEGAAIGGLFGGSGPAPKAPEVGEANPITPGSLYAKKTAAYAPLDSTYFDSPTYNAALTQGHSVIRNLRDPQGQGANLGIPKDVSDIVNNLSARAGCDRPGYSGGEPGFARHGRLDRASLRRRARQGPQHRAADERQWSANGPNRRGRRGAEGGRRSLGPDQRPQPAIAGRAHRGPGPDAGRHPGDQEQLGSRHAGI